MNSTFIPMLLGHRGCMPLFSSQVMRHYLFCPSLFLLSLQAVEIAHRVVSAILGDFQDSGGRTNGLSGRWWTRAADLKTLSAGHSASPPTSRMMMA